MLQNDTNGEDDDTVSTCLSMLFKEEYGFEDDVDMEVGVSVRGATRCVCRRRKSYMKNLCCRRPTCGHWKKRKCETEVENFTK